VKNRLNYYSAFGHCPLWVTTIGFPCFGRTIKEEEEEEEDRLLLYSKQSPKSELKEKNIMERDGCSQLT
jgi:hypothetical protein